MRRVTRLLGAVLIALAGACVARHETIVLNPTPKEDVMIEHPFGLTGDEYWTNPGKGVPSVSMETVSKQRRAIVIDAPLSVDPAVHEELPMPVLYSRSMVDAAEFGFEESAVLVIARREDRRVTAGLATLPPPDSGDGEAEPDPDTFIGSTFMINVFDRQGNTREDGTYVLRVLLRDLVSNATESRVGKASPQFRDPEVERYVAQHKHLGPWVVSPVPGQPIPSYEHLSSSPQIPPGEGIAISVDRIHEVNGERPCVVKGSFRIEPLEREIVQLRPGDEWTGPGRRPSAVIPVTVLVTSSVADDASPKTLILSCPTYDPVTPGVPGQSVTGHFALDLFSIRSVKRTSATLFVYAFIGERMDGPHPIGVVTPDMLGR